MPALGLGTQAARWRNKDDALAVQGGQIQADLEPEPQAGLGAFGGQISVIAVVMYGADQPRRDHLPGSWGQHASEEGALVIVGQIARSQPALTRERLPLRLGQCAQEQWSAWPGGSPMKGLAATGWVFRTAIVGGAMAVTVPKSWASRL